MKALLVNPPWSLSSVQMPVNILELASYVQRNNIECSVLDLNRILNSGHISRKELVSDSVDRILDVEADVVGITTHAASLIPSIEIAKSLLKKRKKVVLGGIGATSYYTALIKELPGVMIIRGEGEGPFLDLLKGNEIRERNIDAKDIPPIDFSLISSPERYFKKDPIVNYSTMRGCLFNCSFCSINSFWHGCKFYDQKKIGKDVAGLRRLGLRFILIADPVFTVNKRHFIKASSVLRSSGISWGCQARIDTLDDETINRLNNSRCSEVYIGIESGSKRMLKLLNKRMSLSSGEIVRRVRSLAERNISPVCAFFIGAPEEELGDLHRTLDLAIKLKGNGALIHLYYLVPIPGTCLYARYKDRVIKFDRLSEFGVMSIFKREQYSLFKKYLAKDAPFVPDNFIYRPSVPIGEMKRFIQRAKKELGV